MALQIVVEPGALAGTMVQYQIRHQSEIVWNPVDVLPITQRAVDRAIVGNGKTVIRGEWKKRQNMHAIDHALQIGEQKIMEQIEGLVFPIHDGVAIGDQVGILLAPGCRTQGSRLAARQMITAPEGLNDLG